MIQIWSAYPSLNVALSFLEFLEISENANSITNRVDSDVSKRLIVDIPLDFPTYPNTFHREIYVRTVTDVFLDFWMMLFSLPRFLTMGSSLLTYRFCFTIHHHCLPQLQLSRASSLWPHSGPTLISGCKGMWDIKHSK